MKSILLVDDHQVVRNGLKDILEDEFTEMVFDEASNVSGALAKLKERKWDLVILDINMPGRSGLDLLQEMKQDGNKTPVLVLSFHTEEQIALRVFKLGAYGFLSKDAADTELVNAVNKILSGKKYITPTVSELLAEQLYSPGDKPVHELLSDREYQTLLLIAAGKTTSQIADEMSLSIPTVSTYRGRILDKMNLNTNAELIKYAVQHQLI